MYVQEAEREPSINTDTKLYQKMDHGRPVNITDLFVVIKNVLQPIISFSIHKDIKFYFLPPPVL